MLCEEEEAGERTISVLEKEEETAPKIKESSESREWQVGADKTIIT